MTETERVDAGVAAAGATEHAIEDAGHAAASHADADRRTGADALTGGARLMFRVRIVLLVAVVRLRLPVRMGIGLFRRVGALMDDATLVPAMAKLEPAGIDRTLDVPYGTDPQQRLDVFRPAGAATALPVIVWVHGGGWVGGTKDALQSYLAVLAARGFVTVGVDYTWAPELRYPGQVEQIAQALAFVRDAAAEWGGDPARVVLAGDSAGAHIVAQLARAVHDADYAARAGIHLPETAPVRGVVLTSGPFRLGEPGDLGPNGRLGDFLLRAYTGRRDYARDAKLRCASLVDDLDASFPPAFVSAGSDDPMLADSRDLAAALAGIGVEVDEAFYPDDAGLPHEFAVDLRRPEAREVLERIAAFAHRHTTARDVSIER